MPPPSGVVLTIKGLDGIQRGFRALAQPELTRTAKPAFQQGSKAIIVPEVKSQAKSAHRFSPSRSRNRGKRGRRGPLARTVTTKLMSRANTRKHNLLFAYSTKPRAWYSHFVIKGTRAHGLLKGAKLRTGYLQAESRAHRGPINRWHPGGQSNDFVDRAGAASQGRFMQYFAGALVNAWAVRARRP